MSGNALQVLDRSTGEIVTSPTFDMSAYLSDVTSPAAFATQQRLAAAYDEAVKALIGPNDVQQEGARTFKKKSAWRKLARHFQISTSVVAVDKQWTEDDFIATVTVRAAAPWGQYADAIGACATSEATGRRVITLADALATAETRATNRATSNLIAMGEVSAEEMGGKAAPRTGRPAPTTVPTTPGDTVLPGASTKWDGNGGKRLADVPSNVLEAFVAWVNKATDPSQSLVTVKQAAVLVLAERDRGAADPADELFRDFGPEDGGTEDIY